MIIKFNRIQQKIIYTSGKVVNVLGNASKNFMLRKRNLIMNCCSTKKHIEKVDTKTNSKEATRLNLFITGSDHRMKRANIQVNNQFEMKRKMRNIRKRHGKIQ